MFTVLDQIANRNHLQLIKAAIPYVNASSQKTISLLVKMMEIQNIIRFYDSGNSRIRGCDTGAQSSGILDMLTDIRSYCEDENEQMMIDLVFVVSEGLCSCSFHSVVDLLFCNISFNNCC